MEHSLFKNSVTETSINGGCFSFDHFYPEFFVYRPFVIKVLFINIRVRVFDVPLKGIFFKTYSFKEI